MENIFMTKIEKTMQHIRSKIENHHLMMGARLPSVRMLAKTLGYSVSTVIESYDRLVAEKVIESRQGAGYFVSGTQTAFPQHELTRLVDREIDPLWISRQSLIAQPQVLKPGCGWLPGHWMPELSIRKALRKVSKQHTDLLVNYANPWGHQPLRHWIARRIEQKGIYIQPDQVLLTESGTQAIDLICRLFLQAGDSVLVDDPYYFNFQSLLKVHRVNIVAVPYTENGPDIEQFEQIVQLHQPKLYITNAGIHNPTGATLSTHTAYQILKVAEQANLTIVEDDIFADFEFVPAPRYLDLNGFTNVIQMGSFSKTVSASIRCGYIAAHPRLIDGLINLKIATNFGCGLLNAGIIYTVLSDSSFRKHLEGLKLHLADHMSKAIRQLEKLDITPWVIPKGGIFLWCQLPKHIDAAELSKICLKYNVILAPGNAFSQSNNASHFLRFNVAQCHDQRIYEVLEKAMQELSDEA
ncbi:PLP-dependent aminotransferase family protein [Acinetobacter qingfengensis]|uniref:GntR family transcriptional regulator n=2 Tax=Acinetobacter qingfengensis TaxID=1262585 RepID=A0A1E7RFS2_9GAMM|nr:PLP-dependent aminotransferase family protein [Acinetobacter qingfengensis]KAA8732831.1 PLP-dependent aminotransferase family protein [Acinetobacter qingfengensis]OEY98218.1 GntR family transcriptional regulator [Acinetobacter qingfengensis]